MKRLIDVSEDSLIKNNPEVLEILLKDRTTGNNILWATDDYEELGESYNSHKEITEELITGKNKNIIQPRVLKDIGQQVDRTKKNAEVFTPSWMCNHQNNLVDSQWFGRKNVFNTETERGWKSTAGVIVFDKKGPKTWQKYVDAKRLEITCGEAPYIVSRYDSSTGKYINIQERIGILDRKFRVIKENTHDELEWLKWSRRAVESVYGYEFQGDSLLLARENILYTYIENMESALKRKPSSIEMKEIATVVSWNIWQMDGRSFTVPYSECAQEEHRQITLLEWMEGNAPTSAAICRIKDWRAKETMEFRSLVKNRGKRR